MGFFRDFKDDVIPEEDSGTLQEVTNNAENEEEQNMSDFGDANVDKDLLNQIFADDADGEKDLFEESQEDAVQEDVPEVVIPEEDDEQEEKEEQTTSEEQNSAVDELLREAAMEDAKETAKEAGADRSNVPSDDETTVITRGTTINGGISSDGSLEIMGTITGDVECLGKLSVFGHISGNVTARDVVVNTKRLAGNIESEGSVEVIVGTIIIGDITGTSATIAGAVKGNIDVNGPVTVDSTAIVKGSIKAKSIQVNTGAVVDGYCSLNYAGVDLEDFFEEK